MSSTEANVFGSALRSAMNIRAELHRYRLDLMFPNRVHSVQMEHMPSTNEYLVLVTFRNGHKVKRPESDMGTDEYKALCMMVYDLPHKD